MGSNLNDVVVGLVSAAIAAICSWLYAQLRRRLQHRRAVRLYPIGGMYASSYTDELNGVRRVVRDEVHIEQHGLQFTGISRNLESRRGFRLEGQIVDDRYLVGTYGGEHRADVASGVFFMTLDLLELGCVHGLWSGFGAEAGTILSGKWSWRKLDEAIILESPESDSSRPLAASLLNDALGSGYVSPDELDELAASPDGMVLLARSTQGEVVGVGTAKVLTDAETKEIVSKLDAAGVRRSNLAGNRIGLLKSAAVVPSARGRGIGLNLVHERLRRLRSMGCTVAVVVAWDTEGKDSSLGVLEAAGFKRLAELPEYWREPEGQETFDCVRCGRPCICSAIVMRRSLYDLALRSEPT